MSAATKVLNNVTLSTHILKFVEESPPARVNRSLHDAHQQMMLATLRQMSAVSGYPVREKLAERLRKVIQRQSLNPLDPQQAAACLRALHQDQRLQAQLFGRTTFEAFEHAIPIFERSEPAIPMQQRSLGLSRFEFAEDRSFLLPEAQGIHFECLKNLWGRIKSYNPGLGGPAIGGFGADIQTWMNDPVNRDALADIPELILNWDHSMMPPEIGKLTGLRYLQIIGDRELMAFPEEMRELRLLREIYLRGTFEEFPPVIDELPALETVRVYSQHLHVLPDNIWRRFAKRATVASFQGVFEPRFFRVPQIDRRLTDSHALTDVPFSLWFIEQVEIPYIDLFRLSPISQLLQMLMQPFSYGGIGFEILPEAISTAMRFLIAAPIWATQVLLNGMILLANLSLFYIVEPLVTLARDLLGYSRMVHARLGDA